jgi:hypothetical protein
MARRMRSLTCNGGPSVQRQSVKDLVDSARRTFIDNCVKGFVL